MIRKAFRMSVHAGAGAEYERRHNPISGDLAQVLLDHGVSTYSIFLDTSSGDLFAYVEFEDEAAWQRVADTEACRRWWAFMRDVMPVNADNSPASLDLREVFHLERPRKQPAGRHPVAAAGGRTR